MNRHAGFNPSFPPTPHGSYHGQVDIGGVQLQVDLPVDGSLAVLVEIVSHLRAHVAINTHTHTQSIYTTFLESLASETDPRFTYKYSLL